VSRPHVPCVWCGRPTTAKTRACLSCTTVTLRARIPSPPTHGLYGGRWVLDVQRRVQVWEAS
jgi:hypothetical protein